MNATVKETILDQHDLDDSGIPYRITLQNAVIAEIDEESGEIVSTEIPAFDSLMASIALRRCHRAEKLCGEDLRFLRRVLGITAKDFAHEINIEVATLSRWETARQTIGEAQERLIRLFIVEILKDQAPAIPIDRKCIMQIGLKATPADLKALNFDFSLRCFLDRASRHSEENWAEVPHAA
ncbi:putative zinc finger/helix-turn-helix protein, YgiT family [alpha proteobacterium Q-1]|nr:putative zinc finger/helix-turn-helix protein, YgiT family [alpha proteobacterium Q-1]